MSATVGGAVKAAVESMGLGLAVYRDRPPPDVQPPYAVVTDGIAQVPERHGDFGDTTERAVDEQAQLDIWQVKRTLAGQPAESYTLVDTVVRRLHGAALPVVGNGRVYGCSVIGRGRLPDDRANTVRDTLTLRIRRTIK